MSGLCQTPLYDAPVAVWYLDTVLWRYLTHALPLDSCCLSFYVTSSILALKSWAVATLTTKARFLSARLDLQDDLLIVITQSICSLRRVLLNVLSTRWTRGIVSRIKWANLTHRSSAALWLTGFSVCRQLQMKGFILTLCVSILEKQYCYLLFIAIDIKHTTQFREWPWFSVATVKATIHLLGRYKLKLCPIAGSSSLDRLTVCGLNQHSVSKLDSLQF